MAATFNAETLATGQARLQTTRPAAAAPGGAAPSADVGAAAAVAAHEADPNPHPELDNRLLGLEQQPQTVCRCHLLEARIAALEQA